eukprot:gene5951-12014_t
MSCNNNNNEAVAAADRVDSSLTGNNNNNDTGAIHLSVPDHLNNREVFPSHPLSFSPSLLSRTPIVKSIPDDEDEDEDEAVIFGEKNDHMDAATAAASVKNKPRSFTRSIFYAIKLGKAVVPANIVPTITPIRRNTIGFLPS